MLCTFKISLFRGGWGKHPFTSSPSLRHPCMHPCLNKKKQSFYILLFYSGVGQTASVWPAGLWSPLRTLRGCGRYPLREQQWSDWADILWDPGRTRGLSQSNSSCLGNSGTEICRFLTAVSLKVPVKHRILKLTKNKVVEGGDSFLFVNCLH